VNNLIDFLYQVLSDSNDATYYHKYYFVPLVERLKRDEEFASAIKSKLLTSISINEQIL
jgi:hypothetical protein